MEPDDLSESSVHKKRKHVDRIQRIKGRKTVQETVLKCALGGLLRRDGL